MDTLNEQQDTNVHVISDIITYPNFAGTTICGAIKLMSGIN